MRITEHTDLVLVACLALLAVPAAVFAGTPTVMRAIIGIPLVFLLPGWALTEALFPRSRRPVPWLRDEGVSAFQRSDERIMMTLGLSIATIVVTGLLLNLAGIPLSQASWVAALVALTIALCIVASARRHTSAAPAAHRANRRMGVLVVGLVCGATGAASIVAAGLAARPEYDSHVRSVWMTSSGSRQEIQLGVTAGSEGAVMEVRLEQGEAVLHVWEPLVLAARGSWETNVVLDAIGGSTGGGPVRAILHTENDDRADDLLVTLKDSPEGTAAP